ncbi:PotD/PotF family extracellular solute-binding protein [Aestuariivirga sp.]|uniref:ABC transporter substrate-binding protein n=1 Tax=Aestuariivirga sp. TaxID=2650926 RepID=UPI0035938EA0
MQHFNRRGVLKLATAAVAMPAIIGRASPVSAQTAFKDESLIVVSWSGNYELTFRDTVIAGFNAKYGTKAETVGGWDQMVPQIKAAPADNPPFDLIVADEYTALTGLAENMFLETDRSKIPGFAEIYPWFDENRPAFKNYGVPFGGGTLWMLLAKSTGLDPHSWKSLWDEKAQGKITLDSVVFGWNLCIPAILSDRMPGIEEVYGTPEEMEPLFLELEKLKAARWYKDGAELANLLFQEEAAVAMAYSTDVYDFITKHSDDFAAAVPKEGSATYVDWYAKVRGTKHAELAELFQAYLLEQETQQLFLNSSSSFMSRKDLVAPAHFADYPKSNEDYHRMFNVFTMDGWSKFVTHWDALDARMKQTIIKTTQG